MKTSTSRPNRMAVRDQSPVDQIPSTQQAEPVAEPSSSETDDLDSFPCAQPRYDDPLFEKIFLHLVTWQDSTSPSKLKEEGHHKSAEKTSFESLATVSSSNSQKGPSHPHVRVKTPPPRSNPSYTEHSTQTTPSLKRGMKRWRENEEEPSASSGLIVQYVRIKKCRIINQAPQ